MGDAIAPPDPPLAGGGVRLRPWQPDDAATIARIVVDPEVPRWTYLPRGMTEDRARSWIGRGHEAAATGDGLPLAIVDARSGSVLGNVGLAQVDARMATGEVFWWLDAAARGRGTATTAVRLLCGWTFDELGLARLAARVEPRNAASVAVAERVGFRLEGVLRSAEPAKDGVGRIDLGVWSLLATDPGRPVLHAMG
jgi:RimJ/RimL family protein N-acetyltransferase